MFRIMRGLDDISRSRNYFILEGITGVSQFVLTTGAFLAGFISLLGGGDDINGVIAVIPAATGIFQIFSSVFFEKMASRKKAIISVASIFRILLATIYFIPILLLKTGYSLQLFVLIYCLSYGLNAFLMPAVANWMINLTPIEIRGQYTAMKDKISLFVSAILTISLGGVLDYWDRAGNKYAGFIIIGSILLLLAMINVFALSKISEPKEKNIQRNYRVKDTVTIPLQSVSFRKVIILYVIWNIGLQIGGPYVAVYMVTSLELSYTFMMALSVVATMVRVLCSSYWGRLADKKSWFLSTKFSILILAITHFMWAFVTESNYIILTPLLHISAGFAWAGVGISLFNIQFLFAKKEGRTMYIGLNAALGGIFSFLSASLGSKIINLLEGTQLTMGFFAFNGMQVVFLLSGLLLLACPLYVHFFFENKELVMETD
ncbi:MFS transporter [Vallitalea okinawensis]|uniref:MFS transporter n=1 Tax=Vallitalea okinawensis TaxID=2078660 RepID=UPI000CFE3599|nr:MFS transporter [Vallitalea okinawensis]